MPTPTTQLCTCTACNTTSEYENLPLGPDGNEYCPACGESDQWKV